GSARASPGALPPGPAARQGARPHEGAGPAEPIEVDDQRIETRRRRGLGACPAREPEPVAEPPRPGEDLERTAVAQLVELARDRLLEVLEVALDLLVTEEIVREGAASREELLG